MGAARQAGGRSSSRTAGWAGVVRLNDNDAGVYVTVLKTGQVHVGQKVLLTGE